MKSRLFVWCLMLLLVGAHFRSRGGQVENLQADWLVLTQLAVALLALALSMRSLFGTTPLGGRTKILFTFLFVAGLSAVTSEFTTKVIGYWLLLAGLVVLTASLVREARTEKDLRRIETAWLVTTVLFVLKDAAVAFLGQNFQNPNDIARLGMGLTHANHLAFYAVLAFWLTFRKATRGTHILLWAVRILLVLIILLTRSRTSIVCLLVGGMAHFWFEFAGKGLRRGLILRVSSATLLSGFAIAALAAVYFQFDWAMSLLNTFNRGEHPDSLATLSSARIYIWQNAWYRIIESPLAFLFGHGYAVSRSVLNDGSVSLRFFAAHSHNDFLEVFVNMGLLGAICYLLIALHGATWLTRFRILRSRFSLKFAARAASVVVMFFLFSLTEVSFGNKIAPPLILFIFYFLSLDQQFIKRKAEPLPIGSSTRHRATQPQRDHSYRKQR